MSQLHNEQTLAGPADPGAWQRACTVQELQDHGRLMRRLNGRQIAIFDTAVGPMACNNQCPHEGYPLSEGALDGDCVLTCNWHNWKFRLKSGENLYGGDLLRTYPLVDIGGQLWIDLQDASAEELRTQSLDGLRAAMIDNSYDRMARELARFARHGGDPRIALQKVIDWSHERMEFGWTHAYAGIADWLRLYQECGPDAELQLVCLLEGIAHVADDVLREPVYAFSEGSLVWHESDFLAAIEAEDETTALSLLRGALGAGLGFAELERAFSHAALAHYNNFGHALIYVCKAAELIANLGAPTAEPLLLSLVRSLVFATREDLIPEFRHYAKALEAWPAAGQRQVVPEYQDWRGLGIKSALKLTAEHAAAEPLHLYYSLLEANAANLLAFDDSWQDKVNVPVSANVGWLDFTHGITFAGAVRRQCTRYPELWPRGLLQMACFSGRNASFTDPSSNLDGWQVENREAFIDSTVQSLFDHGQGEFIVSVHLLKTTLAVREELQKGVPEAVAVMLCAALNRFLNGRVKRRQLRRTANQALQFVARE